MGSVVGRLQTRVVDMSGPKAQFVLDTLKKEKVVIFSKTYCPYCDMAKEQFEKLNFPYHVVELDNRDDTSEIQDILGEMTGARSVPRVFVDGKFIGGGTDVQKMHDDGSLKALLGV